MFVNRAMRLKIAFASACLMLIGVLHFTRAEDKKPPTTQASDPTLDWLMDQAATAPSKPGDADELLTTSQPAGPLTRKDDGSDGFREAVITLSNDEIVRGRIATTPGKPIRIFDVDHNDFKDIPYNMIEKMEAKVVWERDEREWHFVESGSDIREYTGKTYPARELNYTITYNKGKTVTGGVSAPLYLELMGVSGTKTLVLYKRQKGEVDGLLKDLMYLKTIEFNSPATTQPKTAPTTQPAKTQRRDD